MCYSKSITLQHRGRNCDQAKPRKHTHTHNTARQESRKPGEHQRALVQTSSNICKRRMQKPRKAKNELQIWVSKKPDFCEDQTPASNWRHDEARFFWITKWALNLSLDEARLLWRPKTSIKFESRRSPIFWRQRAWPLAAMREHLATKHYHAQTPPTHNQNTGNSAQVLLTVQTQTTRTKCQSLQSSGMFKGSVGANKSLKKCRKSSSSKHCHNLAQIKSLGASGLKKWTRSLGKPQ